MSGVAIQCDFLKPKSSKWQAEMPCASPWKRHGKC